MPWQAILPAFLEALGSTAATGAAAGAAEAAAARAATGAATQAAETAAAQAATGAAESAAANAASNTAARQASAQEGGILSKLYNLISGRSPAATSAGGSPTAPTSPATDQPNLSQVFASLMDQIGVRSPERAAEQQAAAARQQTLSDAYLGATGANVAGAAEQSASEKAAEQIAGRVKDHVVGGATSMATGMAYSMFTGGGGGGSGSSGHRPGGLSEAFALASGPKGQQVGEKAEGFLTSSLEYAMPGVVGMGMADAASGLIDKFGDLEEAITGFPRLMEGWGRELLDAQKHLAQFNGQIATSFAESDKAEILRNIESGQRTAKSTGQLSKAWDELQNETQPYKDAGTNVMNTIGAGLIRMTAVMIQIAESVTWIAELVNWSNEEQKKNPQNDLPFVQFMHRIEENEKKSRDPRAKK